MRQLDTDSNLPSRHLWDKGVRKERALAILKAIEGCVIGGWEAPSWYLQELQELLQKEEKVLSADGS